MVLLDDCPNCERNRQLASRIQNIADLLLIAPSRVTGIPAPLVRGFVEGVTTGAVEAGRRDGPRNRAAVARARKTVSRKATQYQRKYKAAFKKVSAKYKKKSGEWKQNGFKKAVEEAHRVARGGMKR